MFGGAIVTTIGRCSGIVVTAACGGNQNGRRLRASAAHPNLRTPADYPARASRVPAAVVSTISSPAARNSASVRLTELLPTPSARASLRCDSATTLPSRSGSSMAAKPFVGPSPPVPLEGGSRSLRFDSGRLAGVPRDTSRGASWDCAGAAGWDTTSPVTTGVCVSR
jgi:hypothetical protein